MIFYRDEIPSIICLPWPSFPFFVWGLSGPTYGFEMRGRAGKKHRGKGHLTS